MQALIDFFGVNDLIPHGYCLSWSPFLLWLHVVSDLLITSAYYSIPLILLHFIRKRKDLPYPWLVVMFAAFIIACGTTHLLSAITIWIPLYWVDGWLKGLTALLSVSTAVLTLWIVPRALSLPSAAELHAEIGHRKAVEEALRLANIELKENAARTQLLLDSALDGIISMDHNGNIIGWNSQAEHIFGYTSDEALGCELAELIVPPAFREQHRQALSRFTAPKASAIIGKRLEITGLRAGAAQFPLELTVSALEQEDGYFFSAYVRDISERKQAEADRQEAFDRLHKIASQLPGVVFQFRLRADGSSALPYASEVLRDIYRIDPKEVQHDAAKVFTVVHPDDLDAHLASIRASASNLSPWRNEYRLKFTDGPERWLFGNALPQQEEDGSVLWHGFVTDITERKLATEALRETEKRLDLATTFGEIGVWDLDLIHDTAWRSREHDRIFGYESPPLEWGLEIALLHVLPEDRAKFSQCFEEALIFGKLFLECRITQPDQSLRWINARGNVLYDENARPVRMMGIVADITKRKLMEEKLRDSDAFNASILDSLTSHIAVLDADGIIVGINNAWRKFADENGLPKSSDNMLGANYFDACKNAANQPYGDEAYSAQHGINAVLNGTLGAFHLEYPCDSPSQQRWFQMNVSPLQGSRRGVVVSHENITERKLMEDELKASEARFRSIIEASPVPMALNDEQLNITFLNPAFVQTFGYGMDDIPTLAAWWPKAYPGQDYRQWVIETWQTRLEQSRHEHQPFSPLELNINSKGSGLKTVLASAAQISKTVKNEHLVILYDITERKQAELEKRYSEEQLRVFYELDLVGLTITSPEKGWIRINGCLCKMLEYSEQELHQMTWAQLTHPEDLAADIEQFEKLLANEIEGYALEKRFISRTGKIIPTKLVVRSVRKANGELDYITAMVEDITAYKEAESELKRSNAELEQFAYAVSHDMRQPLRMVASYLSLIESALAGRLDEETQQFLNFALNGAKRMDAMILSLLDYSRVGRKSEAITEISSKASLDEALAFLNGELVGCNGGIKVTGEWPDVSASRDELTRLLQNLIGNALKYHEEGQPPQIHVHGAIAGSTFRVEVRDQGIGIDPGQIDRLFKVFSRLQARTRFEGTGVGLALCRKIVEHHGGTIGVNSAGEGQGCVFWFELPLHTNFN